MDPLTITALASAAGGGLLGLFGKKKKKTYTMRDLMDAGYEPYNESEELDYMNRSVQNRLKSIRSASNENAAQYGLDPVSSNFANEEGIHNSAIQEEGNIRSRAKEDRNQRAQMLFQMNAAQPDEQSDLEALFGGALGGLDLGLQTYDILTPIGGALPDPTGGGMPTAGNNKLPPITQLAETTTNTGLNMTMNDKKKKKGLDKWNVIDDSLFDDNEFSSEEYGKKLDLNFRKKKTFPNLLNF